MLCAHIRVELTGYLRWRVRGETSVCVCARARVRVFVCLARRRHHAWRLVRRVEERRVGTSLRLAARVVSICLLPSALAPGDLLAH